MTHKTVKKAIRQSAEVERLRSGEDTIPPPNYDIALCLYEREEDGSDTETPLLSFSRPQDFATNPHMKYQRFGAMTHHEKDDEQYTTCWLIHLYWDGSRDEDSARELVVKSSAFGYGQWQPTAPSDPLLEDDFWDKKLGIPPNGFWLEDEDYEEKPDFKPFDNFAKQPYKTMNFG